MEDGGGVLAFANAWLRDRIEMVGGMGLSFRELLTPAATDLYEVQVDLARRSGRGTVCDLIVLPRTRVNLYLGVCRDGACRGWTSGVIIPIDPLRLGRATLSQPGRSRVNSGFPPLFLAEYGRLDVLSAREAEVLKLLASGRSPSQIAKSLRISSSTVRAHVRTIRRKLATNATD